MSESKRNDAVLDMEARNPIVHRMRELLEAVYQRLDDPLDRDLFAGVSPLLKADPGIRLPADIAAAYGIDPTDVWTRFETLMSITVPRIKQQLPEWEAFLEDIANGNPGSQDIVPRSAMVSAARIALRRIRAN